MEVSASWESGDFRGLEEGCPPQWTVESPDVLEWLWGSVDCRGRWRSGLWSTAQAGGTWDLGTKTSEGAHRAAAAQWRQVCTPPGHPVAAGKGGLSRMQF